MHWKVRISGIVVSIVILNTPSQHFVPQKTFITSFLFNVGLLYPVLFVPDEGQPFGLIILLYLVLFVFSSLKIVHVFIIFISKEQPPIPISMFLLYKSWP